MCERTQSSLCPPNLDTVSFSAATSVPLLGLLEYADGSDEAADHLR